MTIGGDIASLLDAQDGFKTRHVLLAEVAAILRMINQAATVSNCNAGPFVVL